MAIDVNIFIQNKKDDIQKALAILEISVSSVEINNFAKKHNLSLSLIEECKSIFNNFERGLESCTNAVVIMYRSINFVFKSAFTWFLYP